MRGRLDVNCRLPIMITMPGADPGFLKGGPILGLQAKKGGPGGGPILGPMLKSLHSGPKRGVRTPCTPSPRIPRPCMHRHTVGLHTMIGLIGPTNQACRPIQHLQLGGGELDKTELCSQIIEYKMILVGPYKYYERKGVLVDIITIKTKRGAEDTGAGRAGGGGGGPSPQLFMQKSSD